MEKLEGSRILVTGGSGFFGQYVTAALAAAGADPIPLSRSHGYDLRSDAEALQAVLYFHPEVIVNLAATVGGIGANMASPATFFRDNMLIGMNVVHAAAVGRAKMVNVGTVCSYPAYAEIPFKEEDFWNGYPEPTNAPYGIAKKALSVMMSAYRRQFGLRYAYLVPTNMYGPGDNFDPDTSHVIPAMIRRFVEAKERKAESVSCWGTGRATRSFLFAADAAKAVVKACAGFDFDGIVNLAGAGEIAMATLAKKVADRVGYAGKIEWDAKRPDGQERRAVDGTRAKKMLGWAPETEFDEGLRMTVDWWLEQRKRMASVPAKEKPAAESA